MLICNVITAHITTTEIIDICPITEPHLQSILILFEKNYVNDINLENNVEFGIKREVVIRTGHGRASADKFHQYINSIKINKEITIQIKLRPKSRQKAFEYFKKELSKFIERGKMFN